MNSPHPIRMVQAARTIWTQDRETRSMLVLGNIMNDEESARPFGLSCTVAVDIPILLHTIDRNDVLNVY